MVAVKQQLHPGYQRGDTFLWGDFHLGFLNHFTLLTGYDIDRSQLAELDISKIFLKPVSPELLIRNIEESMA